MLLITVGATMVVAAGLPLYGIRHRGENRQPRLLQSDPLVCSLGFVVVCLKASGTLLFAKGLLAS